MPYMPVYSKRCMIAWVIHNTLPYAAFSLYPGYNLHLQFFIFVLLVHTTKWKLQYFHCISSMYVSRHLLSTWKHVEGNPTLTVISPVQNWIWCFLNISTKCLTCTGNVTFAFGRGDRKTSINSCFHTFNFKNGKFILISEKTSMYNSFFLY